MYDEKFYEAVKYVNMTKNLYNMISYNTSMAFWSRLTDKEKEVFKKATQVASQKGAAEVEKRLGGVIANLRIGESSLSKQIPPVSKKRSRITSTKSSGETGTPLMCIGKLSRNSTSRHLLP
jgi:hypothetical protein